MKSLFAKGAAGGRGLPGGLPGGKVGTTEALGGAAARQAWGIWGPAEGIRKACIVL